ncbi:MAG: signal peptidase II [Acidobacteriota bacterium]|nr:MAG: signal peptidase II [Acidobacteriota bacterium]
MKSWTRDLALAGAWFVLDQATKGLATWLLADGPVVVIRGTLRLALSHNRGALFGLGHGLGDPWRTLLLTVLPLLAVAGITLFLVRIPERERFARVGLALILGGAAGNVLDRLVWGHVIDFIDVYAGWEPAMGWLVERFGTNRWPTFNIADIGLVTGAGLLLVEAFRRRPAEEAGPAPDPADVGDEA